jgi:heme/copper-type cytochrome/quinol oxidase subunit 2
MDLMQKQESSSVNKKAIFIGAGIVLVIIVGTVLFFVSKKNIPPTNFEPTSQNGGGTSTVSTSTGPKVEAVDPNTKVPDAGENLGNGTAVPTVVTEAAPGAEAKYRSFNISVSADKFTPDTITVYEGDTVNIYLTSQDKTYTFALPDYGLSNTLTKGVKKTVQFQALSAGKYKFTAGGAIGYMIIVPKQ